MKRHVWTTFSDDQVDLNVRNPEVLLALLGVLLFFVAKARNDPARRDRVPVERDRDDVHHLPQTHDIVRLMRRVVEDVNPATLIVTETNVPHEENVRYSATA